MSQDFFAIGSAQFVWRVIKAYLSFKIVAMEVSKRFVF